MSYSDRYLLEHKATTAWYDDVIDGNEYIHMLRACSEGTDEDIAKVDAAIEEAYAILEDEVGIREQYVFNNIRS